MTREEAIDELTVHFEHWKRLKNEHIVPTDECDNTINALRMAIEALPERPKGEWQKVDEQPYFRKHFDNVCCSVCHHKGMRKYNFCPSCGAEMMTKESAE